MYSIPKLGLAAGYVVLGLAACGGGGSAGSGSAGTGNTTGGSSATCSMFQYQEDAQAYQNAHASAGLDADHDGIACESLPRRPSSAGSPSSEVIAPYASYIDLDGQVHRLQRSSSGKYTESFTGRVSAFSSSTLQTATAQADEKVVLSGGQHELYQGPDLGLIFGPKAAGPSQASAGLGFAWSGQTIASLAGVYRVLGQRCQYSDPSNLSTRQCSMVYGTLQVTSTGATQFCPQADYTPQCSAASSGSVGAATDMVFSGVANEERLVGSARGDGSLVYAFAQGGFQYVLVGIRSSAAVGATAASQRYAVGRPAGIGTTTSAAFLGWTPSANVPLPGMAQDPSGNTYLRGESGMTVFWTASASSLSVALPQ